MHEGEEIGEFRHLLSEIFNGLVETGFTIQEVWEDPRSLRHASGAEPGSYEHMHTYVLAHFSILAKRA